MSRSEQASDSILRAQASTSARQNDPSSDAKQREGILFSSHEVLHSVSPNSTRLVDIVAIVYKIEGLKLVEYPNGKTKPVMTFIVHNNERDLVQLEIPDQLVDKFIDKIYCQHIIHVDGATPKEAKGDNDGNVPYVLIVEHNTIIKDLGKTEIIFDRREMIIQDSISTQTNVLSSVDEKPENPSDCFRSIFTQPDKVNTIVGIVDSIIERRLAMRRDGRQVLVQNFILRDDYDNKLQLVIWDQAVTKFANAIQVGHKIRIARVSSKKVENQFNYGTIPYELTVGYSSTIEDLGKPSIISSEDRNDLEIVPLTEINNKQGKMKIRGFVKSNWSIIDYLSQDNKTCLGSLADNDYYIDIKISKFSPDFVSPFEKFEHVQCIGEVMKTGNSFEFVVESVADIKKMDSVKASLNELICSKPLSSFYTSILNPSKKLKTH